MSILVLITPDGVTTLQFEEHSALELPNSISPKELKHQLRMIELCRNSIKERNINFSPTCLESG